MSNMNFKFLGSLYEVIDGKENRVLTRTDSLKASTEYVEINTNEEKENLSSQLNFQWDPETTDGSNPEGSSKVNIPYVVPNFYMKEVTSPRIYNDTENLNDYYVLEKDNSSNYIASYGFTVTPIAYSTTWYSGNDLSYEYQIDGTEGEWTVVKKVSEFYNNNSKINTMSKVNIANLGDMYVNKIGQVFRCNVGYADTIIQNHDAIEIEESSNELLDVMITVSDLPETLDANNIITYEIEIANKSEIDITDITLTLIDGNNNTININNNIFDLNANSIQTFNNILYTITSEDMNQSSISLTATATVTINDQTDTFFDTIRINTAHNLQPSQWSYVVTIKGQDGTNNRWYFGNNLLYTKEDEEDNPSMKLKEDLNTLRDLDSCLITGVIGDMYLTPDCNVFSCINSDPLQNINNIFNKWQYIVNIQGVSGDQTAVWENLNFTPLYYDQNQNTYSKTINQNTNYFVSKVAQEQPENSTNKYLTVYHNSFDDYEKIIPVKAIYADGTNNEKLSLDDFISNNTVLNELIDKLIVISDTRPPENSNTKIWIYANTQVGGGNVSTSG